MISPEELLTEITIDNYKYSRALIMYLRKTISLKDIIDRIGIHETLILANHETTLYDLIISKIGDFNYYNLELSDKRIIKVAVTDSEFITLIETYPNMKIDFFNDRERKIYIKYAIKNKQIESLFKNLYAKYKLPKDETEEIEEAFKQNPDIKLNNSQYSLDILQELGIYFLSDFLKSMKTDEDKSKLLNALLKSMLENQLVGEYLISNEEFTKLYNELFSIVTPDTDPSYLIRYILETLNRLTTNSSNKNLIRTSANITSYIEAMDNKNLIEFIKNISEDNFILILTNINILKVKEIYEIIKSNNIQISDDKKSYLRLYLQEIGLYEKNNKFDQELDRICNFFNSINIKVTRESIYSKIRILNSYTFAFDHSYNKENIGEAIDEVEYVNGYSKTIKNTIIIQLKKDQSIEKVCGTIFHELIHHFSNKFDKSRRINITGISLTTSSDFNESLTEYITRLLYPKKLNDYTPGAKAIEKLVDIGILDKNKLINYYFHNGEDNYLETALASNGIDKSELISKFEFITGPGDYDKGKDELDEYINNIQDNSIHEYFTKKSKSK